MYLSTRNIYIQNTNMSKVMHVHIILVITNLEQEKYQYVHTINM